MMSRVERVPPDPVKVGTAVKVSNTTVNGELPGRHMAHSLSVCPQTS
jgi:hypothetical protein